MPGQRPILAMSFVASLGITLEVLACTLPKGEGNFWPLLIFIFYLLLPLPMMFSRRVIKDTAFGSNVGSAKQMRDCALFVTSGIMVSSVALPIILARTPEQKPVVSIILNNLNMPESRSDSDRFSLNFARICKRLHLYPAFWSN